MKEVVVLLFVVVFGNGHIVVDVEMMPLAKCEAKVAWIFAQPPEHYAKYGFRAIYAECLRVIPRPVKYE